jgi:hypothetical protein
MARSATRRLQTKQRYDSSDEEIPVNPLIEFRGTLSQKDFASKLNVNKSVVGAAEDGMFQLIPVSYRKRIVDIKTVNSKYQLHRKAKRRYNFDPHDFPEHPSESSPMKELLAHFELTPWAFGAKSCVHHVDIWRMQDNTTQATQNFVEFVNHIKLLDIFPNWLQEFDAALRSDNPVKLVINT